MRGVLRAERELRTRLGSDRYPSIRGDRSRRLGVPLDILLVVGAATLLTLSVMARGARAVQACGLARHG